MKPRSYLVRKRSCSQMAPMSWRRSSAATVSARIRESAKAMSSGIDLSRWWQTMSIWGGRDESVLQKEHA